MRISDSGLNNFPSRFTGTSTGTDAGIGTGTGTGTWINTKLAQGLVQITKFFLQNDLRFQLTKELLNLISYVFCFHYKYTIMANYSLNYNLTVCQK